MRRKLIRSVGGAAWLITLMLMLSVSAFATEGDGGVSPEASLVTATEEAAEEFDCHVIDKNGLEINGYYSEENACWYLFVPSTEDVAGLTLYVQGAVTELSSGELDAETGIITGAFAEAEELTLACNGQTVRVVVMQSDLPSLHIVLNDATLDEVHVDKDTKFKKNSVYLNDLAGEYDLTVEGSVEMKGRGNSTWNLYEKKGYQIKFDSKTSVLGMGKAKKWVLLANASDDSMMRTQLTYQMASQMEMAFVPSFEYIDLWIDGDYRGTYIIGEKIELGSSRLDLEDTKGVLFEYDERYYMEEDYWFLSDYMESHFVLKESVEEDDETVILEAMDEFKAAVDELMDYLYSTPSSQVTLEDLSTMIDVDSFVKYYLVNEYTLNRESVVSSFYWYKDGPEDVIHLGPIWDFDTCMGNDGAGYNEYYGDGHILIKYLLAAPVFAQRVEELMEVYMPLFTAMNENVGVIHEEIADSAEMNYLRWDVLGEANPKGGEDFCDTYEEAVSAVKTWLEGRETTFAIPEVDVVTSDVSDDCYEMTICFDNGQTYSSVRFAVWSLNNGQDDLDWYNAKKNENGEWVYTVDLSRHNSNGIYRIDVYPDDATAAVVTGRSYVETAREPSVWIEGTVSSDVKTMEVILTDTKNDYGAITFAVWSSENAQDDLIWYPAEKNEAGSWVCTVDLEQHGSVGTYHVHAYSGGKAVVTQNLYVPRGGGETVVFTELLADNTRMKISLECADETVEKVWFAVWSMEGGQDDIIWYEPSSNGMLWEMEVDITSHGTGKKLLVHAFSGTTRPSALLDDASAYVPPKGDEGPVELTVEYNETAQTLELTLKNASLYQQVWFPVWTDEGDQDDLVWYPATKQNDGTWTCTADASQAGLYIIHVYGGSNGVAEVQLAETTLPIGVEEVLDPEIVATLTEDGTGIELVLKNAEDAAKVWIPVWSEANDQDDIVWYTPEKQADGTWTCTALAPENGIYVIHVYSGETSPTDLLTDTKVTAEHSADAEIPEQPEILATMTEDGKGIELVLKNAEDAPQIWIPVWSEENAQDDIIWYRPEQKENGTWTCTVNLADHTGTGVYHIHVYSGETQPTDLLAHTSLTVEEAVEPEEPEEPATQVTAQIEGDTLTIVLVSPETYEKVWFPVWSEEDGQDDLTWYVPTFDGEKWTAEVDLNEHTLNGTTFIHVYSGSKKPVDLICHTNVTL